MGSGAGVRRARGGPAAACARPPLSGKGRPRGRWDAPRREGGGRRLSPPGGAAGAARRGERPGEWARLEGSLFRSRRAPGAGVAAASPPPRRAVPRSGPRAHLRPAPHLVRSAGGAPAASARYLPRRRPPPPPSPAAGRLRGNPCPRRTCGLAAAGRQECAAGAGRRPDPRPGHGERPCPRPGGWRRPSDGAPSGASYLFFFFFFPFPFPFWFCSPPSLPAKLCWESKFLK